MICGITAGITAQASDGGGPVRSRGNSTARRDPNFSRGMR